MNIRPITITEFRKQTKDFLDLAKTRDIFIGRDWEVFKLTFEGAATPFSGEVLDKVKTMPPVLKKPQDTLAAVSDKIDKTCKHGFPPAFCRFAKPGKPCK